MDNTTLPADHYVPDMENSLTTRQRDTYMLIGFCFFTLFLIGIFMAFVHRKCRDSTAKAKQWCMAICCVPRFHPPPPATTQRVPEVLPQEITPYRTVGLTRNNHCNPAFISDEDDGGTGSSDVGQLNRPTRRNSLIKCEVNNRLRSSARSAIPQNVISDLEDDSGISDVSTSPRNNCLRSSRHSFAYNRPPAERSSSEESTVHRQGSFLKVPKLVRVLMPENVDETKQENNQIYSVCEDYDVQPYYVNSRFQEKRNEVYGNYKEKHVYENDRIDSNTHLYENDGVVLSPKRQTYSKRDVVMETKPEIKTRDIRTPMSGYYNTVNEHRTYTKNSRHVKSMSNPVERPSPRISRSSHWHHDNRTTMPRVHSSGHEYMNALQRTDQSRKSIGRSDKEADELLLKLARNFFRSKQLSNKSVTSEENEYVEIDENGPVGLNDNRHSENQYKTNYNGADEKRTNHVRGPSLGYHSCPDEDLNVDTIQFVKTADGRLQQITVRYV